MINSGKIDVFKAIDNLLIQAGVSQEDYARHTGLWKKDIPSNRLLTEIQAMEYLGGISKPTFYAFVKKGEVKQVLLGFKIRRYDIKDLDRFIRLQKTKTIEAFT